VSIRPKFIAIAMVLGLTLGVGHAWADCGPLFGEGDNGNCAEVAPCGDLVWCTQVSCIASVGSGCMLFTQDKDCDLFGCVGIIFQGCGTCP